MSNVLIFDNANKPSIMVRVPKFKVSDVIPGGSEETHPAFIVDGVEVPEIYISKYQNIIANGRAYSLPFQKPADGMTFDEAREACEKKGQGWHLMTNAEWAAIALWALKNNTLPRGNNNWGSDYSSLEEKGILYDNCRVLTGSGPDTWAHDHTKDGIFDLNGNLWEWVSGVRLQDGQIQVIPNNNAAKHIDQSLTSKEWEPVMVDGKPFYYCETDEGMKLVSEKPEEGWNGCYFSQLQTDVEVPEILKTLALYPVDDQERPGYFFTALEGERLPSRGGRWTSASGAGLFSLYLNGSRTTAHTTLGFRSAYIRPSATWGKGTSSPTIQKL